MDLPVISYGNLGDSSVYKGNNPLSKTKFALNGSSSRQSQYRKALFESKKASFLQQFEKKLGETRDESPTSLFNKSGTMSAMLPLFVQD